MPLTLQQLIEEKQVRTPEFRAIIGGAIVHEWTSIDYSFAIGQVPTATITVPSRAFLPPAVREEASVQIWFGMRSGIAMLEELVYGGAVVDSVSSNGPEVVIECVMTGARKLSYGYNRRIAYDFTAVTAYDALIALLALAGVTNYYVDFALFEPWIMGTAVPQTIQFSTYGEAINKVSEVDGSPWYCMPSGQVRIELRDPVPSASSRRTYFSGILTGTIETQPLAITNPDAKPRIADISRRKYRSEVANFIEVDGAVVSSIGPLGEQNSEQIFETVDGLSGAFPNGALWIPTPPLFQDFTFSNELIDTPEKAFTVAERYFTLKNRLMEKIPLTIPGDPDVFLGSTVKIVDPRYSGVQSLYFVEGYRTSIDQGGCVTELQLTGGPESGTTGFAAPFADFTWKYQALHDLIPGGWSNQSQNNLGPGSDPGAKLCEDLPADTGSIEQGGDFTPGSDRRTVIIGLDGTSSKDFDGSVVSWVWTYTDALAVLRTMTGSRVTLVFDPDVTDSIEVTLVVTDDSGRTSDITKTIYTSADYIDPGTGLPAVDPTIDDTDNGGGTGNGICCNPDDVDCCDPAVDDCGPPGPPIDTEVPPISGPGPGVQQPPGQCNGTGTGYFIAAGSHALGTVNNRTWNELTKAAAGVTGDFISVASGVNYQNQTSTGIFGTSLGEIVITDDICVTGSLVFTVPGNPRIERIVFDTNAMGDPATGANYGGPGAGNGETGFPIYTEGSPGTMTIIEAYQQALAVGFPQSPAAIAVAIMMAESGLVSNAINTVGNVPPSTDRGIAQINSYYHPAVSDAEAFNTQFSIGYMFQISSGGADFTPWAAFNANTYQQFLTQVQDATGIIIDPNAALAPGNTMIRRALKSWFSTNDGRIYNSMDSGRTWQLWSRASTATYQVLTPPFPTPDGVPSIWTFGGDTGDLNSLMQYASGNGTFQAIPIGGALRDAIIAAGSGFYISAACFNNTALAIGFSGGVIPPLWTSSDPVGSPDSWVPAVGLAGNVKAIAKGFDSEFIVA